MARKEFVDTMEQNIVLMGWLSNHLRFHGGLLSRFSRQHLQILMRLYLSGRAKLKDISHRESALASTLCSVFRDLEKNGMVRRETDEADRRNVFYSVTSAGARIARRAMDELRSRISDVFSGLSAKDEEAMVSALKPINEVLSKMKEGK